MIRILRLCAAAAFLMIPGVALAAENALPAAPPAKFFSSMQDIPLVPGLSELPDQTVSFDKPEGRIVESVAEIETPDAAFVKNAYEDTLPQLGWRRVSDNLYVRERESLTLAFESYEGRNFMRVMVRPRHATPN